MNLRHILSPHNAQCCRSVTTSKSVLEQISKLAADEISDLDTKDLLDALMTREKLGSTAIGKGVAIPHARIGHAKNITAILLKLDKPVKFDAPDDQLVDLFFGLIIPEQKTDEYLNTLSSIAEKLHETDYVEQLRKANTNDKLYNIALSD